MTSPSVQRSHVIFRSEAPGSSGQLRMLVMPHQLHTLKALAEQWNAANKDHAQPVFSVEVIPAKKPPHRTVKVLTNQWGNMSGYICGRRHMEFGTPTYETRDRAKAWLAEELKLENTSISPSSELTLLDVKAWVKENQNGT